MKTNLLIWVKRAVFAGALVGIVGLTLPSCDKEPKEEPYRAPYEKELRFNDNNTDSIAILVVRKYVNDTACKHIYLTVMEDSDFVPYETDNIEGLRRMLQQRIDLGDNISGRGDFLFRTGVASVNDSLWFVQHGWTVNQNPR